MKYENFEEFDNDMKERDEKYKELDLFQRQNIYLILKNKDIYIELGRK